MAEKGKGRSLKDRLVDMGVLVEKDESPSAAQGSAAVSGPGALSGPGPGAGGVDRDLLKQLLAAATKDTNDYTEFMLSADAMSGVIPDEPTRIDEHRRAVRQIDQRGISLPHIEERDAE